MGGAGRGRGGARGAPPAAGGGAGGRRLRRARHLHSPAVIFIRGGNEVVSGAPSVAEPDIQMGLPGAGLPPSPAPRVPRVPG